MSTEAELRKGCAETLILALLEERDRHGYELAKLIDRRSEGALAFHVASLYPTLYRLTAEGRRTLDAQRRSWKTFFTALNRVAKFRHA